MKPAEVRKIENQEQKQFIKLKRYQEFKSKNRNLVEWIELKEFQLQYEVAVGHEWEWPDDQTLEFWPGVIFYKVAYAIKAYEERDRKPKAALSSDRRAKAIAQATPVWRDMDKIKQKYIQRDALNALYGTNSYHVDHIIPIQGINVSGLHCEFNLQILPKKENLSKSNRYLP